MKWDIATREYCLSFGEYGILGGLIQVPYPERDFEDSVFLLEECSKCNHIMLTDNVSSAEEVCSCEGDISLQEADKLISEIKAHWDEYKEEDLGDIILEVEKCLKDNGNY